MTEVLLGYQGTGRQAAHVVAPLISKKSSYLDAHTLFVDAGDMAARSRHLRVLNSSGHCTHGRNAQLSPIGHFPGKKT
jgi:hypothetical protein